MGIAPESKFITREKAKSLPKGCGALLNKNKLFRQPFPLLISISTSFAQHPFFFHLVLSNLLILHSNFQLFTSNFPFPLVNFSLRFSLNNTILSKLSHNHSTLCTFTCNRKHFSSSVQPLLFSVLSPLILTFPTYLATLSSPPSRAQNAFPKVPRIFLHQRGRAPVDKRKNSELRRGRGNAIRPSRDS